MANAKPQPPAAAPDPVKRRAIRRLIAALALIAIAVVGLAVMDRMARKKTEVPPPAKAPVAQIPASPAAPTAPTEPVPPTTDAAPPTDAATPAAPGQVAAKPAAPVAPLEPPPPPDVAAEVPPSPYAIRKQNAARALPESTEGAGKLRQPATGTKPVEAPPAAAPAKTTAAEPEATPTSTAAPNYVVQVGVFSSPINAEALRDRLVKVGIPAHTETRLNVGPFADKVEAERMLHRLRRLGMQAVIVPQTK